MVGALIAGAASAGGVIFVLRSLEPAGEEAPAAATEPTPTEPAPAATVDGGADDTPVGVEPPEDAELAPEEVEPEEVEAEPASRRARRRRARSQEEPPDEGNGEGDADGDGDEAPTLPGFGGGGGDSSAGSDSERTDPLSRALAAQRAGHPRECVQILDDAIRSGASAIALRRRADCYEAAGDRAHAVRDYQRFCRLVPDHPSISEVRPLLASWGHSCP